MGGVQESIMNSLNLLVIVVQMCMVVGVLLFLVSLENARVYSQVAS
jgi:hypothetical protein